MKKQVNWWLVKIVFVMSITALAGCGSESDDNSNGSVDASTSTTAGIDARKSIHAGTLRANNSSNTSTPYIIDGCYVIYEALCPGNELAAEALKNSDDTGLCFEQDNGNYYSHTGKWKVKLDLSKDGKNWSTISKEEIKDGGYYISFFQGMPVSSNSISDTMAAEFTYTKKDSCENIKSEIKCSIKLKFKSNYYREVSNKIYTEPKLNLTCTSPTSGGIVSQQPTNTPSTQDASVLQKWIKQPSGVADILRAIVYGNGKYVAVGDGGIVLTSTDAKSWITTAKLNVIALESVAFGNGKFVTGGWGSMFVSSDGIKWDLIKDASLFVQEIIKTDTLFVAVGLYSSTNGVITSTDGLVWSKLQNGNGIFLTHVAYGDNTLIAVGTKGEIVKSTDGKSWVTQKSPTSNSIYSLAYGNKMFLITDSSGKVYTSIDNGVTWTQESNLSPNLSPIIYNNGKFIGAGYQYIYESSDGKKWVQTTEDIKGDVEDIIYDGSKYVAVGWNGFILTSK